MRFLALFLWLAIISPSWGQLTVALQLNIAFPTSSAEEYGSSLLGYGLETNYFFTPRWGIAAAYDHYRFELNTDLEAIDISPDLAALLNLPDVITLDMAADSWSGGVRYSLLPTRRISPYLGLIASRNRLTAEGYGVTLSRKYWGGSASAGATYQVLPHWGLRADIRWYTVWVRDSFPLIEDAIDQSLNAILVHWGIIYRFDFKD